MEQITFAKHISWQKLPGEEVIIVYNIKTHTYYYFEDTEFYIWTLLADKTCTTCKSIIESCANYYGIKPAEIEDDISSFIDALNQIGVINIHGYN